MKLLAAPLMIENAAPSSALPLGSSRILSPTRLTRVNPSGPAHVTRLLNTVCAIVNLVPEDRLKKDDKGKEKVKEEPSEAVKTEGGEEAEAEVKEENVAEMEEDEDEDEVPFREEIGWREVTGFIVMYVKLHDSPF